MNSVRSNGLNLKYQRLQRYRYYKFEFVAKTYSSFPDFIHYFKQNNRQLKIISMLDILNKWISL